MATERRQADRCSAAAAGRPGRRRLSRLAVGTSAAPAPTSNEAGAAATRRPERQATPQRPAAPDVHLRSAGRGRGRSRAVASAICSGSSRRRRRRRRRAGRGRRRRRRRCRPVPPPPPPLPPIPLKFIGIVEAPSTAQKIAVLSDGAGRRSTDGRRYHRGPLSDPADRRRIDRDGVRRRPRPSDDSAVGIMSIVQIADRCENRDCTARCAGARAGAARRRLRGRHRRSARATTRCGPATSTRRSRTTARRCRRRPTTRTTRSRSSARCSRPRARTSSRRRSSKRRISSKRRSASTSCASEYDPSNRQAAAKVAELDRTIRDRIEAARPRPAIEQMRERARAASRRADAQPGVARAAERAVSTTRSLRDILTFIGNCTGINITYDRDVHAIGRRRCSSTASRSSRRCNQIMSMNQLSYKVLNDRSILVFPDTPQKHAQYDEQVVRTFYLSHADATELSQLLSTIIRLPGIAVQPAIAANKTANTITVRGTSSVVADHREDHRAERQAARRDRRRRRDPRGRSHADEELRPEPVRVRARRRSSRRRSSPGRHDHDDTGDAGDTPATTTTTGASTPPTGVQSPPPFNLNTISRGVSTADFYLAVPTAIVRFLETRHADQARRQAAAARRGRHEADAEPRRQDPGRSRPATRRSRPAAPASTR